MSAKTSATEDTSVVDDKAMAKAEAAQKAGKDYGPWEYKEWEGKPHWIHRDTKESTFDLVLVQRSMPPETK